MSIPIEQFLLNFFPQLRGEDGSTVAFSSMRNPHSHTSAPSTPGERLPAGNVYSGGMPPVAWIQREQRRSAQTAVERPSSPRWTPSTATGADALREQGNTAFRHGSYSDAVTLYTQALHLDPENTLALTNRSFAHYKLGAMKESAKDAAEAVRQRPDFFKAHYRLGVAQHSMGNYTQSLASLRRALELAPSDNQEMILREIAKCESKIARAPPTPLLMSSPLLPATSMGTSTQFAVNYDEIAEMSKEIDESRAELITYSNQHENQESIVECEMRSKRIKQLLGIATSNQLDELTKRASEKQEALRRRLKGPDREAYSEVKSSRDDAYALLWAEAKKVEEALADLKRSAVEEQAFFKRFGSTVPGSGDGGTDAATEEDQKPTRARDGAVGEVSGDLSKLLERRTEIASQIGQAHSVYSATDTAANAFLRALKKEKETSQALMPLLEEASKLNTQLEDRARRVACSTTRELSEDRLDALEPVRALVQRTRADEASFRTTLGEGDTLLELEAQLERERLQHEHQRIQLQAEVEWLKVCDEPERKLMSLQAHLTNLHQRIAETSMRQKKVQQRILQLAETAHPELVWKSMASGSRILRLVKGSGLWLNLSLTDFKIVSTLSSTMNSKVYHATRRGEQVALKEIPVDSEQARRRIQREVSIVGSCNHPNIIRIKGVFFDGPFAYLVLPYYRGGDMKGWLTRQEPMSWVAVQDLFRQLVTSVAYLHERGIVHADIKPSNILLADDGRPVITDFGIAKNHYRIGEEMADYTVTTTNTGTGAAVGTAVYMAPEQLILGDDRSGPTCKSDMWALGVTLYQLAASNAVFLDPSMGTLTMPLVKVGDTCIQVSARQLGGDEQLADMISSVLIVDPARRVTEYELLAHPYFSSVRGPLAQQQAGGQNTAALALSDARLEAVRSYLHAVRSANPQKVLVSVDRNHMVDSVHNILSHLSSSELLQPILVVFQGEAGMDEGALTTEMLSLYYEQIVSQKKALVCAADTATEARDGERAAGSVIIPGATYLPAEDSDGIDVSSFEYLGMTLLKSIIENRPLPLRLNLAVLKYFCGAAVSLADLEEYDGALANTLKRIRILSSEDLAMAQLDFSCFTPEFLASHHDGKYSVDTTVDADNARDYVQLRADFDLIEKRKAALKAMKKGFFSVDSLENHLKLLSPSDLLLLLCGVQHIPASMIIDALEFQGFDASSNTPKHLKELLTEMSQNNLRRFLQLCTSTAALYTNESVNQIKVLQCADTQRLPVGHGCASQLDLPNYNDKQLLKEKLEMALAHVSDGFHIV